MAWGDQRVFGEIELTQRRAAALDPWAITYSNRLTEGLIRREALFDAGGWELSVGFEDWDLYMGLAEAGWGGRRVDAVTYLYRIASSRMLTSARLQHDDLYRQMRERHPRLFAERARNWRRSSAPLHMRLALPLIARLPLSRLPAPPHRAAGLRAGDRAAGEALPLPPAAGAAMSRDALEVDLVLGLRDLRLAGRDRPLLARQRDRDRPHPRPSGRGSVAFLTTIGFLCSWLSTFGVDQAISNIAARLPDARRALAGNAVLLALVFGGLAAVVVLGVTLAFPALQGDASRGLLILVLLNVPLLVLQIYLRQLAAAQYRFGIGNFTARCCRR